MNRFCLLLLLTLLSGCVSWQADYQLDTGQRASSFDQRIRSVVVHYTDSNLADSMRILTKGKVSSHYLLSDQVNRATNTITVYQLVQEDKRAWHAGKSYWRGRTALNDSSIGIEIVNLGHRDSTEDKPTWHPYKEEQIVALESLLRSIVKRYQIRPENIIGHMDIAPQRKCDPGPLFPWERLAKAGLGAWPDANRVRYFLAGRSPSAPVDVLLLQKKLAQYGYEVEQNGVLDSASRKVIRAFQMHFRPQDYAGNPDAESEAILDALLERYGAAP